MRAQNLTPPGKFGPVPVQPRRRLPQAARFVAAFTVFDGACMWEKF
jgi:hypothetical protein